MLGVFVWYNIGWTRSRFNRLQRHEDTLSQDLNQAIRGFAPSGIFLSECGEIEEGLPNEEWMALLRRILPAGYDIWTHSHYTCILKMDDVEVISPPELVGPMCTGAGS